MGISFVHCSDLHLGYNQFNTDERFADFGNAFARIVDYSIAEQVDFMLISGDIFNKRMINAKTLTQAIGQFSRLKEAGIEVIAIEGNHDKVPYGEDDSWMSFLNDQEYFYLLSPNYEQGQLVLKDWKGPNSPGSVLHRPGIRFIGLGYLGSMTEKRIAELHEELDKSPSFTVLLLHSAVDRLMHLGGITLANLAALRETVDYVAMGHVHEYYDVDNWVFNPGAPENWDLGEADKVKGFFHVKIQGQEKTVKHIPSNRRPVINLRLDLTDLSTVEQVYESIIANVSQAYQEYEILPMIRVVIYGQLSFSPLAINVARIEEDIMATFPCLLVEILNQTVLKGSDLFGEADNPKFEREELEKQVLHELVTQKAQVAPEAVEQVVQTARQVHDVVLGREGFDEQVVIEMVTNLARQLVKKD